MPTVAEQLRSAFFDHIWDGYEGHVCIATSDPKIGKSSTRHHFFRWPSHKQELSDFVERVYQTLNCYFCINLLQKAERKKQFAISEFNLVWADLDTCHPSRVFPEPPIVIQSSEGRYQAIWRLDIDVMAEIAENYSKRIAYKYNELGADIGGWDLGQLLRVPFTWNHKYADPPEVGLISASANLTPVSAFEALPDPGTAGSDNGNEPNMPDLEKLPPVEGIIYKYKHALDKDKFTDVFGYEPGDDDDWSRLLWRLINLCLEAGMNLEETFVVAANSKCNKYARDGRPLRYLWRDVIKADSAQSRLSIITGESVLLDMPELTKIDSVDSGFIADYNKWAIRSTDAVGEFHELCAFILLSAVCANNLRLNTSYGIMVPNLWGLVIGDSTLTRKTTAMRMATNLLVELDSELLVATDGSAEGLLTGLSTRPHRTSIFYKDEVTGFFDAIGKKDYLAGMPETLTHLYDVPPIYTRRLRKETITINHPIFIFFGGGIKDRLYELINEDFILSGFLPRFLIVSGDTDLSKIRRTGPMVEDLRDERLRLLDRLADMYDHYAGERTAKVGGQTLLVPGEVDALLDSAAWERYGQIEEKMLNAAYSHPLQMVALPTFERLSRSLLKMAMLIAASRQIPDDNNSIDVSISDIEQAAYFVQRWGKWTIDLIQKSGKSKSEKKLDKVLTTIRQNPDIYRGQLMSRQHLMAREADELLKTLEERGLIQINKNGKATTLRAMV